MSVSVSALHRARKGGTQFRQIRSTPTARYEPAGARQNDQIGAPTHSPHGVATRVQIGEYRQPSGAQRKLQGVTRDGSPSRRIAQYTGDLCGIPAGLVAGWEPVPMTDFPCLVRSVARSGEARYRLGDPVVDRYLEFVAGRARPNTLRAVAFDLKAFFTVMAKDPAAPSRTATSPSPSTT
jgi:hypothetical protein